MNAATRLPFLAQRLFNVPLAIRPEKVEFVMAALADRLGLARLMRLDGTAIALQRGAFEEEEYGLPPASSAKRDPGYDILGGVAVLGIEGILVHKAGGVRPWCGMTGYDGLRLGTIRALADSAVRAIAFDIDSPGGEIPGLFDLVDTLAEARKVKPIWAIVDEMSCSAAYAVASAANRVVIPRTGEAGSIGVVAVHTEMSKMLAEEGITVTILRSSPRKMEGNPYEPLTDAARGAIQAAVDADAELFFATVARNRRGLTAAKVKDLEAACLRGADAVKAGLADAVMAPDAALRELIAQVA